MLDIREPDTWPEGMAIVTTPGEPAAMAGLNKDDLLAQRVIDAIFPHDQVARSLGIKMVRVAAGAIVLSMKVRDDMANFLGSCHGGVIFSLADASFGLACNSRNEIAVAASADITFLRPVMLGDQLSCECNEHYREGRNAVYHARVTNQNGETVALFRGNSRRRGDGAVIDISAD